MQIVPYHRLTITTTSPTRFERGERIVDFSQAALDFPALMSIRVSSQSRQYLHRFLQETVDLLGRADAKALLAAQCR
jgi:hypothetical protein